MQQRMMSLGSTVAVFRPLAPALLGRPYTAASNLTPLPPACALLQIKFPSPRRALLTRET
jgi:hypothetical protein